MPDPVITVGMPLFNNEGTVARAVASVRAQTLEDWRLVILDDGSGDGSVAAAESAAAGDARITVRRQPSRRGAMNFGDLLADAQTPYFVWLAGDDWWAPDFLKECLAVLERDPRIVSVLPRAEFVGGVTTPRTPETGALTGPRGDRVRTFLYEQGGTRMYGLMRTEAAQRAFPLRPMHAYDWALMVGLLSQGGQAEVTATLLFREKTHWMTYADRLRDEAKGIARVFPVLPMTVEVVRRGHLPLAAAAAIVALNLRKHEEYQAVCHPLRFARLAWLYRLLRLPLARDPSAARAVLNTVAERFQERREEARAALQRLGLGEVPGDTQGRATRPVAAPSRTGVALPPLTAVLAVRNGGAVLGRALVHLARNGSEVVVIDHGSTDRTRAVAEECRDGPVQEIIDMPWRGVFDLREQLSVKRDLIRSRGGWIIHADADEFLDPPPGLSLRDLAARLDRTEAAAVEADEVAFLPASEEEDHSGGDFEATMQRAVALRTPDCKQRLFRADLRLDRWFVTGGHSVTDDARLIAPDRLRLRHYPGLSLDDLRAQYLGRVYAPGDLGRAWHGQRMRADIVVPPAGSLGTADAPGGPMRTLPAIGLPDLPSLPDVPPDADLVVVAAHDGACRPLLDLLTQVLPGLRVHLTDRLPDRRRLPPVLHALCHPVSAVPADADVAGQRQAASRWMRTVAGTRQRAVMCAFPYREVRIEDVLAAPGSLDPVLRMLLLGNGPSGAAGFLGQAVAVSADPPCREVQRITVFLAADLAYRWRDREPG